jgi:hypothetical protein
LSDTENIWTKYDGEFKDDCNISYLLSFLERDGFGTLIFSNNDKYVGAFKNGNINGHGTIYTKG